MNKPWTEIERLERRVRRQLITIRILAILTAALAISTFAAALDLTPKKSPQLELQARMHNY